MTNIKQLLGILILHAPLILQAQPVNSVHRDNGLQWTTGLSWEQVKAKAKVENKYIFIDCIATWCAPCKYMDKEVYTEHTLGDYMNDKFISIKVQMDTTKQDGDEIRKWYNDAKDIRQRYDVSGFPTFLFFDPNGDIVHKEMGGKAVGEFITVAVNALNADRQLYPLLKEYQQGKKNYNEMGYLAITLKHIGDEKLAWAIAEDYTTNYLFKLPHARLFTNENIEFIGSFIQNSKDIFFDFFYRQSDIINKVMDNQYYTRYKIDFIVAKEEIDPILIKASNSKGRMPSWTNLFLGIKRKYNESYAERGVLNAKERWYQYNQDWPELHKMYVERYHKYGVTGTVNGASNIDGVSNNMAWDIFEHSEDREIILQAVEWMGKILEQGNISEGEQANMMDTYANLLYKAGRTNEAQEWETKAIEMAKQNNWNNWAKSWSETLKKMQNGEGTWPKE